jgi:hypothetical protein
MIDLHPSLIDKRHKGMVIKHSGTFLNIVYCFTLLHVLNLPCAREDYDMI